MLLFILINNLMLARIMNIHLINVILLGYFIYPSLADLQSGFSQRCYSACPKKAWNLENSSRQQIDKQWIECLKQCHHGNSWKFIMIVFLIVLAIAIICIIVYICWGQKIRLRYTFHVELKKRPAIITEDETKIKLYQQGLNKFKFLIQSTDHEVYIQFQNDQQQKKKYHIQDCIFYQRKNKQLENMFSIIIVHKKPIKNTIILNNQIVQVNQSQNQIFNQSINQQFQQSQLIGSITLTSKGINLWWIKIDQKPKNSSSRCTWCSRKDKKYFAVYEKDPFALDDYFIGNVVLQDSSKNTNERYTKYVIWSQPKLK